MTLTPEMVAIGVTIALAVIGGLLAVIGYFFKKDNGRRDTRLNKHAEEIDEIKKEYVRRDDFQKSFDDLNSKLDKILDLLIQSGIGAKKD